MAAFETGKSALRENLAFPMRHGGCEIGGIDVWKGRFTAETADVVLRFSQSLDLDWRLARCDIIGSIAHARMLGRVGLLSEEESSALEKGLRQVAQEIESGTFEPRIDLEDVHMNIEARLTAILGPLGARLHMGRSRNDQVATTLRLYLRETLMRIGFQLAELMEVLLKLSDRDEGVLVPGYTHLQQAQPISMGHYWLSHFQAFLRDARRLRFAMDSLNECPLGSGALAGSTLPLDRAYTAEILGFPKPTENSLDTVGQRDYLLDIHGFCAVFGIHASRLSEDLILYSSQEFGWIRLPDAFCTGSSMMPQKKNPDVLELVRGRTGQFVGHLVDLLVNLKGLPSTYDRDLQEDKRGLWESLDLMESVFSVLVPLLERVEVDENRSRAGFENGLLLATDVAEYLVLKGVPFRLAHEKVGKAVAWCIRENRSLSALTAEEWKALLPEAEEDLPPLLDARVSVSRRQTYGGTGFEQVASQRARGKEELERFREALSAILGPQIAL
jgi:argininosuccinate lyase